MPKTPIQIDLAKSFVKNLGRLYRKNRQLRETVQIFTRTLEAGNTPGSQIPGVGYTVYKARLPNRAAQKGTRGGYRIIYYLVTPTHIALLLIYDKAQQTDIPTKALRRLIEECEQNG